jgi:purine-cytosine permease-like protein
MSNEQTTQIKDDSHIETRGVEMIPENERNSKAKNVFYVLCGSQFAFGIMAFGALPIAFGLGWWASFWAITLGLGIGSLLIGPLAILSQRTATNGAIASGAHFGVKGRVIGSILDIVIALGVYALLVWTGAQAFVSGVHRLFGWSDGNGSLLIWSVIISASAAIVAIIGHKLLLLIEKLGTWFVGAIVILSLFTFASHFDASYEGGKYLLGSFWPTWILALTTVGSIPISYATFIGDFSRYVPNRDSSKKLAWATSSGMFTGCWLAMVPAAYMMSTVKDIETPFVVGIIGGSPFWWVAPLMLAGILGSLPNGGYCLYSAGLALESLGIGLKRVVTTIIMAVLGVILVIIGVYVSDMISLINAFVIIITVGVSPWLAINLIGYFLGKGQYDPLQLHVMSRSSRYWYSGGYSIPAVVSWITGVIVGLLFTSTSVFSGPFINVVGGIDLSFTSSAIVGAMLYYILIKLFPYNLKEFNSKISQIGRNQ